MSFFTWFTSLSSFHVWMVGCPFSLLSYTPTHTHIHIKNIKSHTFFIHSSIGIHLSYFHILTIMNSTAMNMRERASVRYSVISFVYIPRSRIAESYGRSIFNFLKKLHIVFHNDWNHLYFYQYCTSFHFPQYPCQHLLFHLLDDIWFWWTFSWLLVMLSIISCTCWPFGYLLWKNVYWVPLPFLIKLLMLLLLSCMNSLFWILISYLIPALQIFPFVSWVFILFICWAEVLKFYVVPLDDFCFCCLLLWYLYLKNYC